MAYRVRPAAGVPGNGFTVFAVDAREALDHVRDMRARGIAEVEVLDDDGTPHDLDALERETARGEDSAR